MKIQIIGYSGSGKSTLARILANHYQIPVLNLDSVQFYGNWQERSPDEQNAIVLDFLNKNDNWVIDGNYSTIASERFSKSDITIFLDYSRWYCLKKCFQRYLHYRGTCRPDLPCLEKFDFEFINWILFAGRTKSIRKKHFLNLYKTPNKKLHFKNVKQLENWLKDQKIDF